MKKNVARIFNFIFTIALISFAFYKAGLLNQEGRKAFVDLLGDVNYVFIVLSILITFILNLASAVKWKMLLNSRKVDISLWRLYVYYNIGKFFNLILPTSMGGDVVRIFQLGKFTGKKHTAAASVIVERFTGLLTLILFAIIAVIINIKIFNQNWLSISLIAGVFGLTVISWLVLSEKSYFWLENFFSSKFNWLKNIFTKINKIRKPVLEYRRDKNAIAWALINSIIFQLLAIINVWVSAQAFSNDLNFITCLVAVPVILFIMNIPFSIGGIGLMEFGYVFTFSLFFISPSLSLSTALLIRSKSILDALIGGVLNILYYKENSLIKELKRENQ